MILLQVWIKKSDWNLFVSGFIVETIKDSWNGSLNKQEMKKINVALDEIEQETEVIAMIRKKY